MWGAETARGSPPPPPLSPPSSKGMGNSHSPRARSASSARCSRDDTRSTRSAPPHRPSDRSSSYDRYVVRPEGAPPSGARREEEERGLPPRVPGPPRGGRSCPCPCLCPCPCPCCCCCKWWWWSVIRMAFASCARKRAIPSGLTGGVVVRVRRPPPTVTPQPQRSSSPSLSRMMTSSRSRLFGTRGGGGS